MGNILSNFVQKHAEIRAKLMTKNILGWFGIVRKFYNNAEIVKS